MKNKIKSLKKITIPKCPECKKLMKIGFTTEQQEGDKGKPKFLIAYGVCKKCKKILIIDLIKISEIPSSLKEFKEVMKNGN